MRILTVEETFSTNTFMKERLEDLTAPVALRAISQTAGRGQRGNHWEAAAGENLTFSILWQPEGIAPRDQFALSEAVALGVVDYLESRSLSATVKWPNDIYIDNRKICGILIEHSVVGMTLAHSIIGVGINVNQILFRSDAPNPVSMAQLTGQRYDLTEEMTDVCRYIEGRLRSIGSSSGRSAIHQLFLSKLWRFDGKSYLFRNPVSGKTFKGRIEDVEPTGMMMVSDGSGCCNRYAFKEIEYIL